VHGEVLSQNIQDQLKRRKQSKEKKNKFLKQRFLPNMNKLIEANGTKIK
jgi:hypothetical protein